MSFLNTSLLTRRLALALLGAALSPSLIAQQTWVPMTPGVPAGTPAEIVYDQESSTAGDSFFDVFVHGFWTEDVTPGDGNTYQRIDVPGLGRSAQVGAPDLPVARLQLAVPTGAQEVMLGSATSLGAQSFVVLPYPVVIEELDDEAGPLDDPGFGDQDGTPEIFVRDELIYGGTSAFPGFLATGVAPVSTRFGSIPGATAEVLPGSYDPTTGELTMNSHLKLHYYAPGTALPQPAMTKDRLALAAATFSNWPSDIATPGPGGFPPQGPGGSFQANDIDYDGRYLIVVHPIYESYLADFIEKKEQQGFAVTVITTDVVPFVSCGNLREKIGDWYEAGDPSYDHYALLVGDTNTIPLCPSPTVEIQMSDDLYGSPIDGDLEEEIYVGRLSVDNAGDLEDQLNKIIGYMEDQDGDHYDEALLVAHKEDAPGKYVGAHESVANASYAVAPNFTKIYGNMIGKDDAEVADEINEGKGLVAYRGHGSSNSWTDWNLYGEYFGKGDIDTLTNGAKPTVVWAFNCYNNRIDEEDCVGEFWLEVKDAGAVAHYGSYEVSSTGQNHELDRAMFEAVYEQGITRHGQAIAWAEAKMHAIKPGYNSWRYLLLGDPSMRIRRTDPTDYLLDLPPVVETDDDGLDVLVKDPDGQPVDGILVALHQASAGGSTGGPDGYQVNAYTDEHGMAHFDQVPSQASGGVKVVVGDVDGNEVTAFLPVSDGVWTDFGGASDGVHGDPALVAGGPLTAQSMTTLEVTNGPTLAPAILFFAMESNPVPLKGVTLQAYPFIAMFDLTTDAQGELALATAWPAAVPSGLEMWFQVAFADGTLPSGVSISNAVRGMTP